MSSRHRSSSQPPRASKTCAACGRPFEWRKKWEKVWDEVRYCSDACRSGRYATARAGLVAKPSGLTPSSMQSQAPSEARTPEADAVPSSRRRPPGKAR